MELEATQFNLLMTTKMQEMRTFSDNFERIYEDLSRAMQQYNAARDNDLPDAVFNPAADLVLQRLQEITNIPIPDLDFSVIIKIQNYMLIFLKNETTLGYFRTFIQTYNNLYENISRKYTEMRNFFETDGNRISIEYIGIRNHNPLTRNHTNLENHRQLLDLLSEDRKAACDANFPNADPANIYGVLANITYTNNIVDNQQYLSAECMVMTILKRNRNTFVKGLLFGNISVENEGIQLDLSQHSILSDTSVEGVVWRVGFGGNPLPFATMKYSKVRPGTPNSYNMVHELVIGLALNRLRGRTANFMYVWGGFSCNIPTPTAPLPYAGPLGVGGGVRNVYDFGTLCKNNNSRNMDTIVLAEAVNVFGTFGEVLQALRIPGDRRQIPLRDFYILILQVIAALEIAQTSFQFVHGDLHGGNVLVKQLAAPVAIQIEGGITFMTRYVPVIIDYGLARLEYNGEVLTSLNHNWNGGNLYGRLIPENDQKQGVYMPVYDISRLLAGISALYGYDYRILDQILCHNLTIRSDSVIDLGDEYQIASDPNVYVTPQANPMGIMKTTLSQVLSNPASQLMTYRPANFL